MSALANSQDFNASANLNKRIELYWSKRAGDFGKLRREELAGQTGKLWREEIERHLPAAGKPLKILDVGTGTGFFAILLAKMGHEATGVDLSPKMIEEARAWAELENCRVDFRRMDAGALDFAVNSFDCVVGRNVTWTLPDPEKAYKEWHRILKPGGLLVNFDADYGGADFTRLKSHDGKHAHADLPDELLAECEDIKRALPISSRRRPQWDLDALAECGFTKLFHDQEISGRVYASKDFTYNPVPMFAIGGHKKF